MVDLDRLSRAARRVELPLEEEAAAGLPVLLDRPPLPLPLELLELLLPPNPSDSDGITAPGPPAEESERFWKASRRLWNLGEVTAFLELELEPALDVPAVASAEEDFSVS